MNITINKVVKGYVSEDVLKKYSNSYQTVMKRSINKILPIDNILLCSILLKKSTFHEKL